MCALNSGGGLWTPSGTPQRLRRFAPASALRLAATAPSRTPAAYSASADRSPGRSSRAALLKPPKSISPKMIARRPIGHRRSRRHSRLPRRSFRLLRRHRNNARPRMSLRRRNLSNCRSAVCRSRRRWPRSSATTTGTRTPFGSSATGWRADCRMRRSCPSRLP
jgi:hypothetical protein